MIRPEDLGSMGESFFATLCKSTGLIANKSTDDKGGWDFEIEHPRLKSPVYQTQSYPVFRVQVKASTSKKPQVILTYANLLNLIQYGGASFLFYLTYSKRIFPDSGYLIHIGYDFSKEVLLKIRKKHLADSAFALNKATKLIRFDKQHQLDPLDGSSLNKVVNEYIGGDYLKYVKNKIDYLSEFEKEGSKKSFKITVKGEDNIKAMVNSILGYDNRFRMDCADFNAPFGITDHTPNSTTLDYLTTLTPVHDERPVVTVGIRTSKYGKESSFAGRIYTIPHGLYLPPDICRSRIKLNLFDLIFNNGTGALSIGCEDIFHKAIKSSLREIHDFLSVIKDVVEGSKTYLTLRTPEIPKPFHLTLGSPASDTPPVYIEMYQKLHDAFPKLAQLGLCERPLLTSDLYENRAILDLLGVMGKHYEPTFELMFDSNDVTQQTNANVVIFQSVLHFEDVTFALLAAFFGQFKNICGCKYQGEFIRSEVLGEFVIDAADNALSILEREREEHTEQFISKGYIVA